MILNDTHRFIFLHCRKTGGSSIKAYLNRFLGPADLQVGTWPDTLAAGGHYNRRLWIDLVTHRFGLTLARATAGAVLRGGLPRINALSRRIYRDRLGPQPPHADAGRVRAMAGARWDSHFKFCFVRNPYDRAVSDYRWRLKVTGTPPDAVSFAEFLRRSADPVHPDPERIISSVPDNWAIYTIDDRVAVDHVGRFETLHDDMATICDRIGVPFDPDAFPHTKRTGSGDSYRDWYGPDERALVERIYARELDHFGYRF